MDDQEPLDSSQGESAYDRLFEAIKAGRVKPGDRLREADVAAEFGLSRTPVREALRRLESDGIVEHRPRFGAVVRRLTHPEVVELYEMRTVLERASAEMAAKHALPAEVAEMADLNDEMLAAGEDSQAAKRLNGQLHRRITLAARNRFLLTCLRSLNNALMLLGPTTLERADRLNAAHAEHSAVIDAIASSDAEAAGVRMEEHIHGSLRTRLRKSSL